MYPRIDTKHLNSQVDMIDLARKYTELHREAVGEMSGPCPKCGGDDRFHVHRDGWFACRQCHTERGGAIEFTMWLNGCDFITAVNILQGNLAATPRRVRQAEQAQAFDQSEWRRKVAPKLEADQLRLCGTLGHVDKTGAPGRVYLAKERGITGDTARSWALGQSLCVRVPGQDYDAQAIAIPWLDLVGELVGIRYRFLRLHDGEKQSAESGSKFGGYMFGEHMLTPDPRMTLVICEGELNAMSVWQSTWATRVDVLSIGSKGQRIPDRLLDTIGAYGAVIVWTDEAGDTKRVAGKLPVGKVEMMKSPNGKDANDLLRGGDLGKYICEARLRLCGSDGERMALLWDLYDGGLVPTGLDAGTAEYVRWLANRLGQSVTLREVGGAWFTGAAGDE